MSLWSSRKAVPTLMRIGFSESVAYRAELLIWVLATTMPLIMLALWTAVARDAPVGRFGAAEFTAYFLATFVVRQLTGSWVAWELNFEVRDGTLAQRLLRPLPVVVAYATENLAALPMRLLVAIPVAGISLIAVGARFLPRSVAIWAIWCAAMLGGWLITFLANWLIGVLSLFMESSLKLMDLYLAMFMVFSGYLVPVEAFPPTLRALVEWLPFRYQIGFPVELMTNAHDLSSALPLLARQWIWVAILWAGGAILWRRGLERFQAYGG